MNALPNTRIETEYLMTIHAPTSGPAHQVDGGLAIFMSTDGWVRGPRLTGKILVPTADWVRTMPGGSLRVDARMTVETARPPTSAMPS
jgi:hypothetical protein